MAEEDLAPGKSSVAVNNCIRQLSYCKNDIRDTVGIWGEVRTGWTSPRGTILSCHKISWKKNLLGKYVHGLCLRFSYPSWDKKTKVVQEKCWQQVPRRLILVFTLVLVHTCAPVLGQTVEISASLPPDERFEGDDLQQRFHTFARHKGLLKNLRLLNLVWSLLLKCFSKFKGWDWWTNGLF